jgi:hypothetical protein
VSLAEPTASRGARAADHAPPPPVNLDHLRRMTTPLGVWEHASHTTPRTEHGFCTDDNARALIVVCRQYPTDPSVTDLAATYLRFLLDAAMGDGRFHNRRHADGRWLDEVGSDDSQGRARWALGVVATTGPEAWMRDAGAASLRQGAASFVSPHLRANAFAALGAAEYLAHQPDGDVEVLLRRTVGVVAEAARETSPWPEARLTYDNARLPEALLAAGNVLGDTSLVDLGLRLLRWLVVVETRGTHFSFTPVGGWSAGEPRPAFDQQPVEAAAMAEACARAWRLTGVRTWREHTARAAGWFVGVNDTGRHLYDPLTGGGADGLEEHDINHNRGAESTLAALTALQTLAGL